MYSKSIVLFLVFAPLIGWGQAQKTVTDCPDCPCILAQAERMVQSQEYGAAIDLYNAYKACDAAGTEESEAGIKRVFDLINQQKLDAIAARNDAITQRQRAEMEKERSDSLAYAAGRTARANKNALLALQTSESDPTKALKIAEMNKSLYPESETAEVLFKQLFDPIEPTYIMVDEFETDKFDSGPSVISSYDGKTIGALIPNKSIIVYQFQAGRYNRAFQQEEAFTTFAITQSGDSLLTGDDQGDVAIWNTNGNLLKRWNTGSAPIHQIVLAPNGDWLVTTNEEEEAMFWNVKGEKEDAVQVFDRSTDEKSTVVVSPDNDKVLFYRGNLVKLYSRQEQKTTALEHLITSLDMELFSASKQTRNSSKMPEYTSTYLDTQKLVIDTLEYLPENTWNRTANFSPDGESIALLGPVKINIYSSEGTFQKSIFYNSGYRYPEKILIGENMRWLITRGDNEPTSKWDLSGKKSVIFEDILYGSYEVFRLFPDGNRAAASYRGANQIKIMDLNGDIDQEINQKGERFEGIEISGDGQNIITLAQVSNEYILGDYSLKVWKLNQKPVSLPNSYERLNNFETAHFPIYQEDHRSIELFASSTESWIAYEDSTGRYEIPFAPNSIYDIAAISVASDGSFLTSGDRRGRVEIIELKPTLEVMQGQEIVRQPNTNFTGTVLCTAIAKDNQWYVAGYATGDLMKFSRTGQFNGRVKAFSSGVRSVAISSDNRWLIAGSGSGEIKFLDISNGGFKEVRRINLGEGSIVRINITSDQKYILAKLISKEALAMDDVSSISKYGYKKITGEAIRIPMPETILQESTQHFSLEALQSFGMEFTDKDLDLLRQRGIKW